MFKKSCQLSNQSLVSSKDKKTMIKSHNWCSGLNSFGQLMVSKLTGSKGRVYFVQSENEWIPAIVDSTGKLDIFPTIFYLWMSNEILPVVETNLGVSSYIMNGADLMWPGVRNFEMVKGIQLGTWVAIATRGNCMPYAVGKYLGYQGEDLKGKCVEVYHYYRDKLWETKPLMPNIGFTFDEVLPIAKPKPVEMSTPEVISEQDSTQSQVEESSQQSTQNLEETKEHSTQNEELRLTEETSELIPDQSQDAPEAESELTTEQADENLYRIFLTALKVGTTDDMIPLEPSALIQILSRCTGRLTLDIKKSSYKRIGKFLESMSDLGLISFTSIKGKDHAMVTKINRQSPDYTSFIPIVTKPKKIEVKPEEEEKSDYPRVVYTPVIKPQPILKPFLESLNIEYSKDIYFQKSDVREFVTAYVKNHNLEAETSKSSVVHTDEIIQTVCDTKGYEISKKDLYAKFLERFNTAFIKEYTDNTAPSVIKVGSLPSIRIFEKKQRNKKVTIIQGVEFFEIDIKELASRLQRVLSSGTTITERVTTDHVKLDVTIQGFKAKLMVPILTGYYKVPSSSINLD